MTDNPKFSLADIRKVAATLRKHSIAPKPLSMEDARRNNRSALRKRKPKLCIAVGTKCYFVKPSRLGK